MDFPHSLPNSDNTNQENPLLSSSNIYIWTYLFIIFTTYILWTILLIGVRESFIKDGVCCYCMVVKIYSSAEVVSHIDEMLNLQLDSTGLDDEYNRGLYNGMMVLRSNFSGEAPVFAEAVKNG